MVSSQFEDHDTLYAKTPSRKYNAYPSHSIGPLRPVNDFHFANPSWFVFLALRIVFISFGYSISYSELYSRIKWVLPI